MKNITIEDLTLHRRGGFTLGPISLEFRSGVRTALAGPSGAGKTTLLRCLAGLEQPSAGAIRFADRAVFGNGTSVPPEERSVGFVFQSGALWPHMTVMRHLRFAAPDLSAPAAHELLAQVGLRDKHDRRPSELSGGEAQRLGLARALAGSPELLLLDEPLRSLDPHLREDMARVIRTVTAARDLTTILVTHDRTEARELAEDIAILADGQLAEHGDIRTLTRHPSTAFGATLLSDATCLPTADLGNDELETPLGRIPKTAIHDEPIALILLPGDSELCDAPRGVAGTVVDVLPTALGDLAVVDVGGYHIRTRASTTTEPGANVHLRLTTAPRLLPMSRTVEVAS